MCYRVTKRGRCLSRRFDDALVTEARERTEFHTRIHTANGGVVTATGCMFSTGRPYRLQLPLALCRTCWPCNAPTSQSCEVGLYLLHPISTDTQGTVVPDGKEFCEKCDVTGLSSFVDESPATTCWSCFCESVSTE